MTVCYIVKNGIYINLTNRCTCSCSFCIRKNASGAYGSDSLWLEKEPDSQYVLKELFTYDLNKYEEIVFCGYGEPLERYDTLIEVAKKIKEKSDIKIRINTNGHGNHIAKRNIVPDLKSCIDEISISLNAPDEKSYNELCKPNFEGAFFEMLDFARLCVKENIDTVLSVVRVISDEDVERCRQIAKDIGAKFRVREKD